LVHDEGPSQEDIERFSQDETGFCPHCGEEIWDDASSCPSCHEWLRDGTTHQNPIAGEFNKRWLTLITLIVLTMFVWGIVRYM